MSRSCCFVSILNPFILSLLFLLLSTTKTASSSPYSLMGSRTMLREIHRSRAGAGDVDADRAVDLNATNFDSALKETPAAFAIVEFFAHWCPACRNYKPHYEKVARLFNGPEAVHPGVVLMTRVDCAQKINNKLCEKFSVGHYPMLFWAPPSKFVSGHWEPKEEKSGMRVIDDGRTDERLLNWINKQLGSSYALTDRKFENELLASNVSDAGQIARAVYDVEEATATVFDMILEDKMIKSETRAPLIKFLQLLVAHHPSRRCRKGSAEVLVNFDELCPIDKLEVVVDNGKNALGNFQICGKNVPRGYWMFCRGSKNDTRGFSCGLWVLLHSLSVRIEDGESQFAFTTVCGFVHNFFTKCKECRDHFDDICKSVRRPFSKSREFALWLWSAHNKINGRLIMLEALGPVDPMFPKVIWPTRKLCPTCYTGHTNWNQDEVFKFLISFYGTTLVSIYKDRNLLGNETGRGALEELVGSTNAIVVSIGAALAIAFVSCAFVAITCYWRTLQKAQKQRRNRN